MHIRFYLFEKSPERQVESACRLCRKILQQQPNAQIWLYCPDKVLQNALDDLLWQFEASSFIAHDIDNEYAPINISAQLPQHFNAIAEQAWIVFNFSEHAFDWQVTHYQVIEIIEHHEQQRQIGRAKFATYKQLGLPITVYKL